MSSSLLTREARDAQRDAGAQPLGGRLEGAERPGRPGSGRRLLGWGVARRRSAAWLAPLLLLAGVVHRWNMGGAPQRIDDEGTYTAQAYAVERLGELAHYTYWYDHPPLGWLQIAAWTWLTDAFDRLEPAVLAGREAMLVAHLASVVLLWALARRLRLSRPAAAAAVLLYALSPLAVQFHRTVYLDNVATPWMLAAFVLGLAPRRQLAAFTASAACFGIAVLSKETYLLLLPFLAWAMWRRAHRDTRRYTLSVAATLLVLIGVGYVVFSLVKGELVPSQERVSLMEGLAFQLLERSGSGSVFEEGTLSRRNLDIWLSLDAVLPVAGVVAAVIGLGVRRLRPFAAAFLFLLAVMLRPGYLPVPYVIAMIPLAVLLVAGVVDEAVRRSGRALGAAVLAVAALATGTAAVAWVPDLRGLLLADLDRPMRQAHAWIEDNVEHGYRLVVDDALWVDLVEDGRERDNVVWYYKVDTDPAVIEQAPGGWRDYDYIVSTNSLRNFPSDLPVVGQALANSTVVASFGEGAERVEVLRVHGEGLEAVEEERAGAAAARSAAGASLAANPGVTLSQDARERLTSGQVDGRVIALLALVAARHEVVVDDFPAAPGEEDLDLPRRAVALSAVDGEPIGTAGPPQDLLAAVRQQRAPYAPESVGVMDGTVVLRFDRATGPTVLPAAADAP